MFRMLTGKRSDVCQRDDWPTTCMWLTFFFVSLFLISLHVWISFLPRLAEKPLFPSLDMAYFQCSPSLILGGKGGLWVIVVVKQSWRFSHFLNKTVPISFPYQYVSWVAIIKAFMCCLDSSLGDGQLCPPPMSFYYSIYAFPINLGCFLLLGDVIWDKVTNWVICVMDVSMAIR